MSIPDVDVHVLSSAHLVNVECAGAVNELLVDHLRREAAS